MLRMMYWGRLWNRMNNWSVVSPEQQENHFMIHKTRISYPQMNWVGNRCEGTTPHCCVLCFHSLLHISQLQLPLSVFDSKVNVGLGTGPFQPDFRIWKCRVDLSVLFISKYFYCFYLLQHKYLLQVQTSLPVFLQVSNLKKQMCVSKGKYVLSKLQNTL